VSVKQARLKGWTFISDQLLRLDDGQIYGAKEVYINQNAALWPSIGATVACKITHESSTGSCQGGECPGVSGGQIFDMKEASEA